MKLPPYLLKFRFYNPDHMFSIWLPLFLIWPIALVFLLAIFVILLPFALLTMLFTWQSGWLRSIFLSLPVIFQLFGYLPGLIVDVKNKQGYVYLEFV